MTNVTEYPTLAVSCTTRYDFLLKHIVKYDFPIFAQTTVLTAVFKQSNLYCKKTHLKKILLLMYGNIGFL